MSPGTAKSYAHFDHAEFEFLKQPGFKLSEFGHVRFHAQGHNIVDVEEEDKPPIHIKTVDARHCP
jgi:hypothetical protein